MCALGVALPHAVITRHLFSPDVVVLDFLQMGPRCCQTRRGTVLLCLCEVLLCFGSGWPSTVYFLLLLAREAFLMHPSLKAHDGAFYHSYIYSYYSYGLVSFWRACSRPFLGIV